MPWASLLRQGYGSWFPRSDVRAAPDAAADDGQGRVEELERSAGTGCIVLNPGESEAVESIPTRGAGIGLSVEDLGDSIVLDPLGGVKNDLGAEHETEGGRTTSGPAGELLPFHRRQPDRRRDSHMGREGEAGYQRTQSEETTLGLSCRAVIVIDTTDDSDPRFRRPSPRLPSTRRGSPPRQRAKSSRRSRRRPPGEIDHS